MALSKKHRLSLKKDVEMVLAKGRVVRGRYFLVKFLLNGLPYNRFAVIISKKISKKATERNLIRRRMHTAISKLDSKNGFDVVFITNTVILGKPMKEINSEIDQTTNKIFV